MAMLPGFAGLSCSASTDRALRKSHPQDADLSRARYREKYPFERRRHLSAYAPGRASVALVRYWRACGGRPTEIKSQRDSSATTAQQQRRIAGLRRHVFEQIEQQIIRPVDVFDEDQQAASAGDRLEEDAPRAQDAFLELAALRWVGHHAPVAILMIFPKPDGVRQHRGDALRIIWLARAPQCLRHGQQQRHGAEHRHRQGREPDEFSHALHGAPANRYLRVYAHRVSSGATSFARRWHRTRGSRP
jgi:hypothetical protein